jgi:hypothetical protein
METEMAYSNVQFIAWGINTDTKTLGDTEMYVGMSPPESDIVERIKLVGKAIDQARVHAATKVDLRR